MSKWLNDEETLNLLTEIQEYLKGHGKYLSDPSKGGDINAEEALGTLEYYSIGDLLIVDRECSDEIGESAFYVFSFRGKHYKVTYNYRSHYGSDFCFAKVCEVTPVEKVVTVYE